MEMMMAVIMEMIGPVLRARSADTECREPDGHHVVGDSRLEKALPRLTRIVSHLWLVARFLQTFLRRVAHVVTLMYVVHIPRIVCHFEHQIFRVILRY